MESGPPVAMVSHHAEAVGCWHQLLDGYQVQEGRGQQEGQRNWERQSRTVGRLDRLLLMMDVCSNISMVGLNATSRISGAIEFDQRRTII
jgi:hypothetical protein